MSAAGYAIDLNEFSLEKLRNLLTTVRLLPSQQILREDMNVRFVCLQDHGLENLQQLQDALKTKMKVQSLSLETGIPVDYLTVLRREVNSYQPKPIRFGDFPGIAPEVVARLDQAGVRNTLHLFPHVLTPRHRKQFSSANNIEPKTGLELTKLTDVARLKWVGPKFARLLVESEYDTVERIAQSDYEALFLALGRVNEKKKIYRGSLGIEDLKLWVTVVVPLVPQVIEY